MRILIIGGGGFIGLNLAERMLHARQEVMLFDTQVPDAAVSELRQIHPACHVLAGDARDSAALAAACARGVEAVVFGAAITTDAARDAADPETILDVNLLSLVRTLRAARDAGVRRIVNLGSVAALGAAAFRDPDAAPDELLDEAGPADPATLYGISKFAGERVAARLAELWRIDVRSVRLSAAFGRWERLTGARSTPSPQFQIAAHALAGRTAILDRAGLRDWIYGPDVAEAVWRLVAAPEPAHALYHVSSARPFNALQWGQALGKALAARGPPSGFSCRLAKSGEVANVCLHGPRDRSMMDTARARTDLGFEAQWDLEASCRDYATWLQAHRWCFEART